MHRRSEPYFFSPYFSCAFLSISVIPFYTWNWIIPRRNDGFEWIPWLWTMVLTVYKEVRKRNPLGTNVHSTISTGPMPNHTGIILRWYPVIRSGISLCRKFGCHSRSGHQFYATRVRISWSQNMHTLWMQFVSCTIHTRPDGISIRYMTEFSSTQIHQYAHGEYIFFTPHILSPPITPSANSHTTLLHEHFLAAGRRQSHTSSAVRINVAAAKRSNVSSVLALHAKCPSVCPIV